MVGLERLVWSYLLYVRLEEVCGITGFVARESAPDAVAVLERMTSAIRHRGPDDFGYYQSSSAFLGHRRLSIVDLHAGQQPMFNEDRSLVTVFNGEIFNHGELRPELEKLGHCYQNHSDTETILHAFEEWGPRSLDRYRGMFSFVIWDDKSRTLFAARDRLGIKPFYYYWDGRLFAFASEIKALLQHPDIISEPDDKYIAEYLAFGYLGGEATMFRGIRRLLPGHWLRLQLGSDSEASFRVEQYWDVPAAGNVEKRSDADWIKGVRTGLEESVRLRLMSDVPLGTFLSGGVDSSAITALMARMTTERMRTFSVGYREARYSELGQAEAVATFLGTEHHAVSIGPEDFFAALPALVWHEDEPIAWPSSVSLYFVSRLAARHVKVVLTGEGSDELFAGYERYRWNQLNLGAAAIYDKVPQSLRAWIRSRIQESTLLGADTRRRLGHTLFARELTPQSLFLDNFYAAFGESEQRSLLREPPQGVYDAYLASWNARPDEPVLERMLYADDKNYLVELLMKQDQMSMAASIESRVPFLDHQFLAMARGIPAHLKIRRGEQKYILKKAVEDLLPHEIVYRKKMGFPTPLKQWLREPTGIAMLEGLAAADSFLSRWARPEEVGKLIESHISGRQDATDRLWRLLNLETWGKVFFGKTPLGEEAAAHLERIPA